MRNLLITKFGTPTGAGPGRPSVSVGLARVGAPSGVRMSPGFVFSRFLGFGFAGSSSSRNLPGEVSLALSFGFSASVSSAGVFGCAGPPSWTFLTGALISRKLDRLGRRARRDVDGGHDLLATLERDRDDPQLRQGRK